MAPQLYSIFYAHRNNPQNDIAMQIIAVFKRFSDVISFTVEDRSDPAGEGGPAEQKSGLGIRNVGFSPFVKRVGEGDSRRGIADMLMEFVQQRPEALAMLYGRTFTRTLHQLLDTQQLRAQRES
jgi:hypothetical protein